MFVRVLISLIIISALAALAWYWWTSNDIETTPSVNALSMQTQQAPVAEDSKPQAIALIEEESKPSPNITLATQINDIADAYQQSAQFPIGSQPVTNPEQIVRYQPFEETAVEFPFPSEAYGTVTLSLATDKFQYFAEQEVDVLIQLTGVAPSASVSVQLELVEASTPNPSAIESLHANAQFNGLWEATARFSSDTFSAVKSSPELQINAYVQADNEDFFTSSVFRYEIPSATVTGLDNPNPNAEYLDIPVDIEVHEAGYYYLSAVLFDISQQTPLIQLQQEARLASGDKQITLKAHIQALKYTGNEGPYALGNIQLRRGAEEGEEFDQAGNSERAFYELDGFAFDRFDNKPYDDPLAAEREAFLRQLSQVGSSN